MQNWLIPANEKEYCHQYYFDKDGFIDWEQKFNYEVDDIVYIYSKDPIKRVKWKTVVEKINIPISESAYPKDFENSNIEYLVRFKLLSKVNMEELSYDNLRKNGLKSTIQKPMKLYGNLLNYIEKYFEEDEDCWMVRPDEDVKEEIMKSMWMVRAGDNAFLIDEFIYRNLVAFRFGKIGDLTGLSEAEIKQIFEERYPGFIEKKKKSSGIILKLGIMSYLMMNLIGDTG